MKSKFFQNSIEFLVHIKNIIYNMKRREILLYEPAECFPGTGDEYNSNSDRYSTYYVILFTACGNANKAADDRQTKKI